LPEITDDYVRIPVPSEEGKHKKHTIKTITISKKQGIKGLYCVTCKKVITYMFALDKGWNMKKAKDWMGKHKFSSARLNEEGKVIFEHFNENGILQETITQDSLIEEADNLNKSGMDKMLSDDRTIFIFGDIRADTAENVIKKLLYFDKVDSTKPVKLIISSFGGSAYSSFAIIDAMEYVQCPIETIGIGMVMSGGLLIFMAGDERKISQTASILSHRFWTMRAGTQAELKADQVEEDRIHQRMIDHYVKFSKYNTQEKIEGNLLKETNVWLTPSEAIENGLADDFFDKEWFAEEVEVEENKENLEQEYEDIIKELMSRNEL